MEFPCLTANFSCLVLASVYVGSLYIWQTNGDRNHPSTVKRRFFSAFCMLFIAPLIVHLSLTFIDPKYEASSLPIKLGLRRKGLLWAVILPLVLTLVLFLGPIMITITDGSFKDIFCLRSWKIWVKDILWFRNTIVAPISEEFTFRACMLPQLLCCFSSSKAMLFSPIFFGVGHFHHMIERWRQGMPLTQSLLISCFQFTYTTLFGIYAAFLFLRSGHIAAPIVAHAFCNVMGFPDFGELVRQSGWKRILLSAAFMTGLIGWYSLLWPLTEPTIYSNDHISAFL